MNEYFIKGWNGDIFTNLLKGGGDVLGHGKTSFWRVNGALYVGVLKPILAPYSHQLIPFASSRKNANAFTHQRLSSTFFDAFNWITLDLSSSFAQLWWRIQTGWALGDLWNGKEDIYLNKSIINFCESPTQNDFIFVVFIWPKWGKGDHVWHKLGTRL